MWTRLRLLSKATALFAPLSTSHSPLPSPPGLFMNMIKNTKRENLHKDSNNAPHTRCAPISCVAIRTVSAQWPQDKVLQARYFGNIVIKLGCIWPYHNVAFSLGAVTLLQWKVYSIFCVNLRFSNCQTHHPTRGVQESWRGGRAGSDVMWSYRMKWKGQVYVGALKTTRGSCRVARSPTRSAVTAAVTSSLWKQLRYS